MARRQPRIYMPQFRQQMVELVRLGRKYEDLGPEFGCTLVVDPAAVKRAERDELARLRRENRKPKLERGLVRRARATLCRFN